MAQGNVEIIQRLWAHFSETGEPDFSILDSEIEIHDHEVPDAPVYRGDDGYVTLERRDAQVLELRDEKVVRTDYFNNRAQALDAAGLS